MRWPDPPRRSTIIDPVLLESSTATTEIERGSGRRRGWFASAGVAAPAAAPGSVGSASLIRRCTPVGSSASGRGPDGRAAGCALTLDFRSSKPPGRSGRTASLVAARARLLDELRARRIGYWLSSAGRNRCSLRWCGRHRRGGRAGNAAASVTGEPRLLRGALIGSERLMEHAHQMVLRDDGLVLLRGAGLGVEGDGGIQRPGCGSRPGPRIAGRPSGPSTIANAEPASAL